MKIPRNAQVANLEARMSDYRSLPATKFRTLLAAVDRAERAVCALAIERGWGQLHMSDIADIAHDETYSVEDREFAAYCSLICTARWQLYDELAKREMYWGKAHKPWVRGG